ncbi:uncharacterized protein UTRI_00015_B [Ustilago trichophora]|uniref:Uncharacterized protein n=1 Tax=Ustilago trichophora TaxID=86804 RepID=A0A5C3DQH6_9BASI|nr:uncharacterized protein UTRI_00015_B [Ustilago trichophora]
MKVLAIISLAALCTSCVVQAQPVTNVHRAGKAHRDLARGGYQAITKFEDKINIGLAVSAAVAAALAIGTAGLAFTQHLACEAVAKQEKEMQQSWEDMHPDGFAGKGDSMRPASFNCNEQERRFKPLISYTNAYEYY